MKEIVVPIVVILMVAACVLGGFLLYYKLIQRRTEMAELAMYRELADRTARNQEELNTRLAELIKRVDAVEQLLRSVE
ncbi:hypothetical protein Pth03_36980 [Planotetraspora thailandica]|uniref:Uncharacterized protein n=1 Tax=Planotetraspora thailandica TaxID=487172 RepID=A0A8J3XWE6_9ACTN|nr:hypothetical protein [Planotetraspora thailandica]GII55309.1 hypothetical protein Pth03_36980 [Planotetraspora thailandica]